MESEMKSSYIVSARSEGWPLSVFSVKKSELHEWLPSIRHTITYVPDTDAYRCELKTLVLDLGFRLVEDDEPSVWVFWKEEGDLLFQVNLYDNGVGRLQTMLRVPEGSGDYLDGARWTTVGGKQAEFLDEPSLREGMECCRPSILIGVAVV
jgi:hypothetical protein